MADERISSFITPEALAELASAEESIESITERIIASNAAVKNAEGFVKQAKSIKDLSVATNTLNKEQEKQAKAAEKLVAQQEKMAAAAAKAAAAAQQKAAVDKLAEDSLKKLSQALDKHRDSYNRLTAAERENANIGGVLLGRIKELDAQLKSSDASMGKFNRNVGNYSSAMSGLGFSMRTIAGELPNLGMSLRTFTQSLSNNIGPLSEAIGRVREENRLLAAEGKPTVSVGKQIAASIFNWQTAILAAVAAITYLVSNMKHQETAAEKAEKANKKYSDSLNSIEEGARSSANAEVAHANVLASIAADTEQTMETRLRAVKELQATYPTTLGNLEKEAILEGRVADAIEETTQQLLNKAAAQAAEKKFAAASETIYDLELALRGASTEIDRLSAAVERNKSNPIGFTKVDFKRQLDDATATYKGIAAELNKVRTQQRDFLDDAVKSASEAGDLFTEAGKADKKDPLPKKVKDLSDEFEKLNEQIRAFYLAQTNPSNIDKDIKNIQDEIAAGEGFGKTIADVFDKDAEARAKARAKALEDVLIEHGKKKLKETKENAEKRAEIEANANKLVADATQIAGELDNLSQAVSARRIAELDREIEKVNEKREAEINAINASMASEEEKTRAIAEANIKADAEERRIDRERIDRMRKAAIISKAINVAEIISTTALAVIKQLAATPLPLGAPFVAAVVGVGAAKLATALATPIPQYEEGTKGKAHKGGPALLFEGNKPELVLENGKAWIGSQEGIHDLAAGAHVVSNKDLMRMANMYTLGMPALIPQRNRMMDNEAIKQGLEQVRKAIENKPVSQMSITNGGITGLVRTGQQNIQYLNNLKC